MYNSNIFNFLQKEFDSKKNAHSYIFYTNDFLKCKNDIELLIKHIFKNENLNELENDYFVIKKSEKKNIQKEDIVELKKVFLNTSYINNYRLYLIEEVHKLNSTSANMILKFLEEPSSKVIAFFITSNLDSVISTIKSRCQIINVFYENKLIYDEKNIKIIDEILKKDKNIALFSIKNYFKNYDRNMLIELFNNYIIYLYNDILNYDKLILIKRINKVIKLLNNNINTDYVFDSLFLEGDLQ